MPIIDLDSQRRSGYPLGQFDFTADILEYDYKQGDYGFLRDVYEGKASTGFPFGAILAQSIVSIFSGLEIGVLPAAVVTDKAGDYDEEKSIFANRFLKEQHSHLLEAVNAKNFYGDIYLSFNLDRNIESIPPDMLDPGYSPFTGGIASAKIIQNKYIRNTITGRKNKVKIIRTYDEKEITYTIQSSQGTKYTKNLKTPTAVKIKNPLGVCPILHLPNHKQSGYTFGFSDFHYALPLLEMYHRALIGMFKLQQYSGKPILAISGIETNIETWFAKTFGIDIAKDGESVTDSKIYSFFKRHNILAMADNTKAEFIEAMSPTGRSTELLQQITAHLSRITSIPEFMFGANQQNSGDTVAREQYSALKTRLLNKQLDLEKTLRTLIKWAMVWYTTYTKNEETGVPLEAYGVVGTLDEAETFKIDLIWPEFLGADARLKTEALGVLASTGAISRYTLIKNFPQYIPNAEAEITRIEAEMQQFAEQVVNQIPQTSADKNAQQRKANTEGSGTNKDTENPSREKAGNK